MITNNSPLSSKDIDKSHLDNGASPNPIPSFDLVSHASSSMVLPPPRP